MFALHTSQLSIWKLSKHKGFLMFLIWKISSFTYFFLIVCVLQTTYRQWKHTVLIIPTFADFLHVLKRLLSTSQVPQARHKRQTEGRFHFGSSIQKYKVDKNKEANIRSKRIPFFLINILLDCWFWFINLLVSGKMKQIDHYSKK